MTIATYHFTGLASQTKDYRISGGGTLHGERNNAPLGADQPPSSTRLTLRDRVSLSAEALALAAATAAEETAEESGDLALNKAGRPIGETGGEPLNAIRKRAKESKEERTVDQRVIDTIRRQIQEAQSSLDKATQALDAALLEAQQFAGGEVVPQESVPSPQEGERPATESGAAPEQAGKTDGGGSAENDADVKTQRALVVALRNKIMQLNQQLADALRGANGGGSMPGLPGIPCKGGVGGSGGTIGSPYAPAEASSPAPERLVAMPMDA